MKRVHTLKVIFGHPRLTEALLRSFFDARRERETPVKKLWLENVRIVEGTQMHLDRHKYELSADLDFAGLESIRLRRLPLPTTELSPNEMISVRSYFNYSRGGTPIELQNGLGGNYLTSTRTVGAEAIPGHEFLDLVYEGNANNLPEDESPFVSTLYDAHRFDDAIYQNLSKDVKLPDEVERAAIESHHLRSILTYQGLWQPSCPHPEEPPEYKRMFRQLFRTSVPTAAECSLALFRSAASTLTSLNLDWALTYTLPAANLNRNGCYERWISWYLELFDLRFPHLVSFQYRNAVVKETELPSGLYLLDYSTVCTGNGEMSLLISVQQSCQTNMTQQTSSSDGCLAYKVDLVLKMD